MRADAEIRALVPGCRDEGKLRHPRVPGLRRETAS